MKYNVDIKSSIIGFASAVLVLGALSFKHDDSAKEGRYQTAVGEKGIVILDTQTGAYILNMNLGNNGWRKGDFANTHKLSKGN
jgi:hypothetical protein